MSQNNMIITPYLTFNGNCKEAMEFYKEIFNGDLEMQTFENSPVEIPEGEKYRIMHAVLKFENIVIMASDGMPGQEIKMGDSVSISIGLYDVNRSEMLFDRLSEGGNIKMQFQKTFWGAKFGYCTDKFGINWMINCEIEK